MQFVVTLVFLVLFYTNSFFLEPMFPEISDKTLPRVDRLDAYGDFWVLRSKVYEAMFFTALLIPLFKRTAHSMALIWASGLIVLCSFVDKAILSIYDYHIHDLIVALGAAFVYYKKYEQQRTKLS